VTPDPARESLAQLVDRQAGTHGERECLSFGDGTTFRYGELAELVARARGMLTGSGVEPGHRVALMMRNSLFFPIAWLGVTTAGATAVPLNARYGSEDAGYVLEHSRASLILCDSSTEPVVRDLAGPLGLTVLAVEEGEHRPKVLAEAEPTPPGPSTGRTLANIQYTSGTTGLPKGCLLTHSFWQRMGQVAVDLLRLRPGKRILTAQPFSYIDPMWNVVATLRSGSHLVMLDGFHPSTFMRDVAAWRVNAFYCLGVMPTLLLKQRRRPWDRDHVLERVFCSAIPPELHAEIEARWDVPWFEVFGMTETGINIAVSDEEHDHLVGSGSLGRVLPHCEVSVVDEQGREVPPGRVGELRLRGLGMMDGYLDDPQSTARFFRDGWANTGDLVTMDEQGRLFFRGRRKEMIRRGGENVSQTEVEFALRAHPDVLDCAVAPVPDEAMGEEGKAYVVMVPGRVAEPWALHAFLAAKLASFKVPRYWEFRGDLPRTPSERAAKSRLEEGRPSWRAETYDAVAETWLEP
jgi:crotonobetaine/carnitine-CoA ligase